MAILIGQKITGAEIGDQFGRVVGTNFDGSIVAVGTTLYDTADLNGWTGAADLGLVKIYKNVNNNWTQIGSDFTGEYNGYQFGIQVSFNYTGDTIAIGTLKTGNFVISGRVQVFKHDLNNLNDEWYQVGEDLLGLTHEQVISGTSNSGERAFVLSLNAEGNIVAIGAYEHNAEGWVGPTNSDWSNGAPTEWKNGIVRIFEYRVPTEAEWNATGDTWNNTLGYDITTGSANLRKVNIYKPVQNFFANNQRNQLAQNYEDVSGNKYWVRRGEYIELDDIPDNENSTNFGSNVSISADGNRVTVSASGWDASGIDFGLIRTFDYTSGSGIFPGTYTQIGQDLTGIADYDRIAGLNLSSDGTTISFGSWRNANNNLEYNGYAKIYTYNSTNNTWEQKGDTFYGESTQERFGRVISLNRDGSVVAIGSSTSSDATGNVKIYQYNNTNNTWIEKNEMFGENIGDGFGYNIGLDESGKVIIVGVANSSGIGYAEVYYTSVPNIRITASEVINNFISNDATLSLTFTSTQTTNDFTASDINVSNGAISSFSGSGTTYTATFTPATEGACTIDVSAGVYTDPSGNINVESEQFNWTYNVTSPLIAITATEVNNNGSFKNDTISLTFTSTQATSNFALEDITVSNGVLSSFSGSGTTYTATFQASSVGDCTIDVSSGSFTNDSSVSNITSRQFKWTYDNVPPTMTITSLSTISDTAITDGSTTNDDYISFTFISNKVTSNFTIDSITVSNGSLSNFSGSGTTYSVTFTPTGSGTTTNIDTTINVAEGAYTDLAGNNNTATSEFNWTYDTVPPVLTITSNTVSDGGITNNQYIKLIITSSKPSRFYWENLDFVNATAIAESLSGQGLRAAWTGTFRSLSANSISTVTLGAFRSVDEVGNLSVTNSVFNWTWDNIQPTMTITSDTVSNGSTTNDPFINLTFTSSKETLNFTLTEYDKWIPLGESIDGSGGRHYFGQYVTMNYDGDIIAVGGVGRHDANQNSTYPYGSILVYQYQNNTWNQLGSAIHGPQDSLDLGRGVSLNKAGDIVTAAGFNYTKVYKYLNNDWSEIGSFTSSDNAGWKNSINLNDNGDRIIFGERVGNSSKTRVYEYSETTNSWSQLGNEFSTPSYGSQSQYVQDIDGSGNRIIIGSYKPLTGDSMRQGHGYILDWDETTSTWIPYANADGVRDFGLGAGGSEPLDYAGGWGSSGAISGNGNVAAWGQSSWTGAPVSEGGYGTTGNPGHTGRVQIFGYNETTSTWSKMGGDIVGEKRWGENEGLHIRLSYDGTIIMLSSTGSDTGWTIDSPQTTTTNEGQIRLFKFDGTDWVQLGNDIEGEASRTIGNGIDMNWDGSHIIAGRGVGTTGSVDVFNINLPGSTVDITTDDIEVTNGTLSDISGSGTTYTATFTPTISGPTTINVLGGVFTDTAGNKNVAASEFTWNYDIVGPTMTITSTTSGVTDGSITNDSSINLTFTSNEFTSNFTESDITVTNGSLSNFSGSGTTYTATFTPTNLGATTINVVADTFTDAVGNNNTAAPEFSWTFDNVPPTITITSTTSGVTDGSTTNDSSINLTFTSSKVTSNFIESDITTSGGSLSNFTGSGTTYTATFTPTSTYSSVSINVVSGAFTDIAGNNNIAASEFNWTYDAIQPTMTISSTTSGVIDDSTTNDSSINITFTSSKVTSSFTESDITVINGSLSNFSGSGTTYTATFTPINLGATAINVAGNTFTDLIGNNNTAASEFNWTFDNVKPTMTITTTTIGVTDGSITSNPSIDLVFTSSKSTTNFIESDISVSNGTITNFSGSGTTYTATFTPTEIGATTIDVLDSSFTDLAGNTNTATSQFNWTFDDSQPNMTISSTTSGVSDGSTTNDETIALTFTSSKATTNFTADDITVSNGSLSNFSGSGTTYTATFTPANLGATTINVAGNTFTDTIGNSNIAASEFNWTYDNVSPTMTISSTTSGVSDGSITNDSSINLTFTSSKVTSNFIVDDITASGGSLSNFTGSGTIYTATFTPTSTYSSATINVVGGAFTDIAGNNNTATSEFNWTYDNVKPTMTISSTTVSDGTKTNDATIALTFSSSKSTSNFVVDDITVSNGSLSNFSGSGTTYTATFTPTNSGATTINVSANTFTDSVGNNNTAASEFNWTFDNIKPTMTISSTTTGVSDNSATNNSTIALTFTSSKATTNFAADDITVSNGSLSNFSGSGTTYTATFTPENLGATTINVAANTFTDEVGNNNTAASEFNWTYDNTQPSMTISSTTSGVSDGSITNDATIELTFTSSKFTSNFVVDDITVSNGSLSNFSGSGTTYTATFTPITVGATTINVAGNTFTDTVGNNNTVASEFNWTFDNIPPTITIASTTSGVTDGSTTNDATILLTFTSSKATSNFVANDITTSGGLLSNFSGSGTTYTATFTPTTAGATTINVNADKFTDIAGNNNTAAIEFNWTYDNIQPTITISSETVSDGDTTNDATIPLTFTSSKTTSNFVVGDITVSGGTLSNFASKAVNTVNLYVSGGDSSSPYYTFYTDSAGTQELSSERTLYLDTKYVFHRLNGTTSHPFYISDAGYEETTTSNIILSGDGSADSGITGSQSFILTFNGLTESDTLSYYCTAHPDMINTFNLVATSSAVYTAIFTPSSAGATTINVAGNTFTDAFGNNNTAASQFDWTYDNVKPTMTITSTTSGVSDSSTTNDATIALTFTSSKTTTNFAASDISVFGGSLSNFLGSGTTYTATFTPTSSGATTINVAGDTFTDAVGNNNIVASEFNWTYDNIQPSMTISSSTVSDGSTTNNSSITLTFTSSKATSNFVKGNITISGGTLSNFTSVSSTIYTAIFTPTTVGATTINVAGNTFTDLIGNNNTAASEFNWTYDNIRPTMTISSTTSGVSDGSTTNDSDIALTFTTNKPTSNFVLDDITVSNGSLSDFSGSGTTYTATFTPIAVGATTINIAGNTFTDAFGNNNTAASEFDWTFDNVPPTITITSTTPDVTNGSITNDSSINLTFTSSKVTSNFIESDITTSGGSLSNFTGSGTIYTATFTPSGSTSTSINVAGGVFNDEAGNNNTAATEFNWTYDNVIPTISISSETVSDGDITNNSEIALTFTISKPTSNFVLGDITVSNGSLSNFSGSGTTYTATFTPLGAGTTTIDVNANKFTDIAGNNNTAASQFNWTYDNVKPTMTISSSTVSDGSTTNNATIELTFTSSKETSDFADDIIVTSGGTLSNFAGSGTTYTATFTPTGPGATSIDVNANKFTDAIGNSNTAASQFNWTYDNVSPSITISSGTVLDGSTSNNSSITLSFTTSKATSNFGVNDITVTGGNLSDFSSVSSILYIAIFTPSGPGATTINVAENTFTDAFNNNNIVASEFNWTYDNVPPNMTISSTTVSNGSTTNNATIALTFTSSKTTSNFTAANIIVSNGSLSFFSGSGTTYTATFTPTTAGTTTINVAGSTFTDNFGNNNSAASEFNWTYDNIKPTMTIISNTVSDGDITNDANIPLIFTSSKTTSNFVVDDITVSNGVISNFSGSGTTYTATFTPSANGASTVDVLGSVFTDTVGNNNTAASQFNLIYDNIQPTMTITTSTTGVTNGSITDDSSIELVFTSSESTTNFVASDIAVSNGTIGNLSGSGNIYTTTFTPTIGGLTTIDVPGSAFTDAGGNNNVAANQFNWIYNDYVAPELNITAVSNKSNVISNGSTTEDMFITLTFTSTKSTDNFVAEDIDISGGTINDFSKTSPTVYTTTFTPSENNVSCIIDVSANVFSDAAGNNNLATQFNWTFSQTKSTASSLTVGYKIDNISLTDLSEDNKSNIIDEVKQVYSNQLGLDNDLIEVTLSQGSVIVDVKITLDSSTENTISSISNINNTIESNKTSLLNIVKTETNNDSLTVDDNYEGTKVTIIEPEPKSVPINRIKNKIMKVKSSQQISNRILKNKIKSNYSSNSGFGANSNSSVSSSAGCN